MTTIVCQGLQSCLDTQLAHEKTMLTLTLSAPKPIEFGANYRYEDTTKKAVSTNPDLGGWSFLQSLCNTSQGPKQEITKETPYLHPLAKPSSCSRLSKKSLELCTENLGSETGTEIIESSIFCFSSSDSTGENSPRREEKKPRQQVEYRKENSRNNFPPPLTTLSGSNSLQVRPHREGGRLIIKAVDSPWTHSYFKAERSNGRLRLCFSNDYVGVKSPKLKAHPQNTRSISNFDFKVMSEENEERWEDDVTDELESDEKNEEGKEEENQEDDEGKYEDDEEENDVYVDRDMGGNSFEVGVDMGMETFQRPSRCNEAGCGNNKVPAACNWAPFWVAT